MPILTVIFSVALAALVMLNGLLLLTAFTDVLKIWPAAVASPRQRYIFWTLFRGGLGLTILRGVAAITLAPTFWQTALGVTVALAGLGVTIYGYFDLGIDNTYGSDDGLVTTGLYQYSRNPQYVASIIAFTGLAIAAGSVDIAVLCGLAVSVYVLLPLAEEPWLERAYGSSYMHYRQRTPRFLSIAKLLERPALARR
jgi:steroid 5-alpha reductase family enzyme